MQPSGRLFAMGFALLVSSACHPRVVPVGEPVHADVQLMLTNVSRVWIAGFHTNSARDFDINLETVNMLRGELLRDTALEVVNAEPLVVRDEEVFANKDYWRQLAEEHGFPLIVTGTVRLLVAPPQLVERGRHRYIIDGRVLDPAIVIIDGRTGNVVLRQQLPRRTLYGIGRRGSTASLYFELMHREREDWLHVIGEGAGRTEKRLEP